jgi:hypothetical protein
MSHHVSFNDLPEGGEKFDPAKASKVIRPLLALGGLGALGSIGMFTSSPSEFAYSWLFAVFFGFTLVVGGCFWILLHAASNSSWGVAVRRVFENLANLVPLIFLLALPFLLPSVQKPLWEWMNIHRKVIAGEVQHGGEHAKAAEHGGAAADAHHADGGIKEKLHHAGNHVLSAKAGYMNLTFWHIRFFLYFLILWHIARVLRRKSVQQDQDGDIKHTIKSRFFACRWLLFFALTVTFAAYDWLVALDYTWFSTMYGVYIFAGCAWSSMALSILVVSYLRSLGYMQKVVTGEHFHLMGKLLFAFTVFWAYIAFSQYFLIWYANITEETRFFLIRNTEGWRWVSIILMFGHFVVPFVFLLQQQLKKNPGFIIFWSSWVLVFHALDVYWNVIPERGPSLKLGVLAPGAWIGDVIAFATVAGLVGYVFLRGLGRSSLYPCRDPRLIESVNVVN